MLSNEIDILKEIDDCILEPVLELKEIKKLLKLLCGKKKRDLTTGPVIKPVRFEDNTQNQQTPPNLVVVKALNNTNQLLTARVDVYNLGALSADNNRSKTKDNCIQEPKILFFSQTIEVQPQSTLFLPVDITPITEYEIQVLGVSEGMYVATEFLPSTPIPTAQGSITSPNQNTPGAVIDSHIVTYSHQFVDLVRDDF